MRVCTNLYAMDLNDAYEVGNGVWYIRVPGGWVMESSERGLASSTVALVFIPYNEEFKPRESANVPVTPGPEPRR